MQDIEKVAGRGAASAFEALLRGVVKVDCVEPASYSYGVVEVDLASATMAISSRDASGRELCRKRLEAE